MPNRTDPRTARTRTTTLEACERLIDSQYARTFRGAALIIYEKCKIQKDAPTGFCQKTFDCFYAALCRWRKHPDNQKSDYELGLLT